MKTKTINTYNYSELSDKAKETARDWYREASAGDNYFADSVIDDAKQCFALCGYDISEVYWSGFSSQGDGACFEGTWKASKVDATGLKAHAPIDAELHRIADRLADIASKFPEASFSVKHSGNYSHRYCTEFDIDLGNCFGPGVGAPIFEETENDLVETSRDAMQWIYRSLETAYDYENSDESIAEAMEANEYEFTKEGKRSVIL